MNKKTTILLLVVLFGGALAFGARQSFFIKDFFNKTFMPTALAIDYEGGGACVQDSQCAVGLYCETYGVTMTCISDPDCAPCAEGVVYLGYSVEAECADNYTCQLIINNNPGPYCGQCLVYEGGGSPPGGGGEETCVINNVDNLDKFIFKDAGNNNLAFFTRDGNFAMYQYNQDQVIYNYVNQNTAMEEFTAIKNGDWDYCADNDYNYYEIPNPSGKIKRRIEYYRKSCFKVFNFADFK